MAPYPAFAQETVTITGARKAAGVTMSGFGDFSVHESPFSATVVGSQRLLDAGVLSLAEVTRIDASISDAYNAPGYWGQVAVRGFVLDNRFNFRRDGLPISAETVLPMANKRELELLKGVSGVQAGTSAPGGLVNLVVKRPLAQDQTSTTLSWTEPGTWAADLDVSRRTQGGAWRLTGHATRLDPMQRASRGHAHLLAAAAEWGSAERGRLEVEFEWSRQSQPSTPGFSLLGGVLPAPETVDPRLNLNNQAWSLPVVFEGRTGSVRYTRSWGPLLQWTLHGVQQRLRTDDRIAFPFGCDADKQYDRFCGDGSFDFYDYRSEDERRTQDAWDSAWSGRIHTGAWVHDWRAGVLWTRSEVAYGAQAFNPVGLGRIDGTAVVPADPSRAGDGQHRDERSVEFRLQDVISLGPRTRLWLGARHTRIARESQADGTRYAQRITTPWAAMVLALSSAWSAYANWGEGVESEVAPNLALYRNANQALPALRSRQFELGLKWRAASGRAQAVVFDIRRPQWRDVEDAAAPAGSGCSEALPCTRRADGVARHRGLELEADARVGALVLRGSAMRLLARREASADARLNGQVPVNVPAHSLKLQAVWDLAAAPGLSVLGLVTREGGRQVLPGSAIRTQGWSRLDLGLRYPVQASSARWQGHLGVDNVTDARAWKESPFQFGHAYVYPLAPRTWRVRIERSL